MGGSPTSKPAVELTRRLALHSRADRPRRKGATTMKPGIHPDSHEVLVHCACPHTFKTRPTIKGDRINVETCSNRHPFFTAKQNLIDTARRLERLPRKYAHPNAP